MIIMQWFCRFCSAAHWHQAAAGWFSRMQSWTSHVTRLCPHYWKALKQVSFPKVVAHLYQRNTNNPSASPPPGGGAKLPSPSPVSGLEFLVDLPSGNMNTSINELACNLQATYFSLHGGAIAQPSHTFYLYKVSGFSGGCTLLVCLRYFTTCWRT